MKRQIHHDATKSEWTVDDYQYPIPDDIVDSLVNASQIFHQCRLGVSIEKGVPCAKFDYFPKIKKVIFNASATIVLWEDNTKTVVKCAKPRNLIKKRVLQWLLLKNCTVTKVIITGYLQNIVDERI